MVYVSRAELKLELADDDRLQALAILKENLLECYLISRSVFSG